MAHNKSVTFNGPNKGLAGWRLDIVVSNPRAQVHEAANSPEAAGALGPGLL